MTKPTFTASFKEKIFAKALTTMLKPLVHLLIRQNITYPGLLDFLKTTYVEVAEESFKIEEKRLTDSRISLLTGVHRGDVKRIRNEAFTPLSEKEIKASVGAQIMSVWTGHQAYLNKKGAPATLFRYAHEGSPSFETLVLSVSKDKHPRSILDEWLHQGIITLDKYKNKEYVCLVQKGYVPEKDFEEKLFFAGKNIGTHLSVVAHNLENKTPPLFDRAVYYHHLTEESIQRIETASKEKLLMALTEINQLANKLQEQDKQAKDAVHSMHVGAYFYPSKKNKTK